MPNLKDFRLPDVGEGLTEADILTWTVKPGDVVEVNQIVVEVETAKAAVELPSPYAGTVAELHAAEGDTVEVGRPIITIDVDAASGASGPDGGASSLDGSAADGATIPRDAAVEEMVPSPAPPADATPGVHDMPPVIESTERQPVLVGYGPRSGAAVRRRRKAETSAPVTAAETASRSTPGAASPPEAEHRVLAKPPVRKLAKSPRRRSGHRAGYRPERHRVACRCRSGRLPGRGAGARIDGPRDPNPRSAASVSTRRRPWWRRRSPRRT